MADQRITVWVQQFKDRKHLMLQWIDPATGKRRSRSAGTGDRQEARYRACEAERQLNNGGTILRQRRRSTRGYVYLVEGDEGCFQIGKSINPEGRVAILNTGFHGDLGLVHQIQTDDMGWLENLLHRKLAVWRVRGEWFLLSSQDIARLQRVAVWNRGFPSLAAVAIVDDPWYREV
jgi:hypothetical protein